MQVIVSHMNTDFDALASMIAAHKLYPRATVAIPHQQAVSVQQFLAIYRDELPLTPIHQVDWSKVRELILVDVASLDKIGVTDQLDRSQLTMTVYDHHPPQAGNDVFDHQTIEAVGATITLLIEIIRERSLPLTPFESTLFGLGLYTDTGYFIHTTTTSRDLEAASFLRRHGMNLQIVRQFSEEVLYERQRSILNALLLHATSYEVDGLRIVVSTHQQQQFEGGLSTLTQKVLHTTGADAVIAVVEMKNRIYIVCRARSNRIDVRPLLADWGGGGHVQAGSATIKNGDWTEVCNRVSESLHRIVKPAITARQIMSCPVKTIPPLLSIEEAGRFMYRYGHTGFPVVEEHSLVGMISRRDLDKALHHGLGHAPVKAYMSTDVVTIDPDASLETIQQMMIRHNIGRLPVMEGGRMIGIISRTDVIEQLHQQTEKPLNEDMTARGKRDDVNHLLEHRLSGSLLSLFKQIGELASHKGTSVYLIGGMVRDLLLGQTSTDVDLTVEGDGVRFADQLARQLGGEVTAHETFGTAVWEHPSGLKVDIASSRYEYYDYPAALPDVESSTLKHDLYRRDFTINAMAICLNTDRFGELVDPFCGQDDLRQKRVKVLHNLSFVEDPTRLIRAVRLELRLQFAIDPQTERLALESGEQIRSLSATRIGHELEKLFREVSPSRAMKRLDHFRLWQHVGVTDGCHPSAFLHAEQLENTMRKLTIPIQEPGWFAYFVIPFYCTDQLEQASSFAASRKDEKWLQEISELKSLQPWQHIQSIGELHRTFNRFSAEAIMFLAAGSNASLLQLLIQYVQKRHALPAYLTGNDLIRHGLKPGATFAHILLEAEVAALNGHITSKEQALHWLDQW